MVMHTGCLIYFYGKKYQELGTCALNSFKKHNPDVILYHVNESNENLYKAYKLKDQVDGGLYKYMLAANIMSKENHDKMIIIGADTITCSRLDEFLDNDEADIITTLDYPYQTTFPRRDCAGNWRYIYTPVSFRPDNIDYVYGGDITGKIHGPLKVQFEAQGDLVSDSYIKLFPPTTREKIILDVWTTPLEYLHYNADVVCFNNFQALTDTIKTTLKYKRDYSQFCRQFCLTLGVRPDDFYSEQGGLNIVCSLSADPNYTEYNYKIKVADGPCHKISKVVYNARAKGNIAAKPGEKPWGKYTNKFYTKDNKLFTGDNKQVKVWHYCEGLGSADDDNFKKLMNNWIFDWFNEETKSFFKEQCDTADFFEKEFTF